MNTLNPTSNPWSKNSPWNSTITHLSDSTQSLVEGIVNSPELTIIRALTMKHPELRWLTWKVDATPEVGSMNDNSKSIWEIIFPHLTKKEVTEFNRTAIWILCLYRVYNWWEENYNKFTQCQTNEDLILTFENFTHIHEYTRKIIPTQEDFDALVIYTIINDLWKITSVVEQIQIESWKEYWVKTISHWSAIDAILEYRVRKDLTKILEILNNIKEETQKNENVDHDKVLLNWLEKHPEISPWFSSLWHRDQEKILTWLRWEFNMGQFLQAENLPANLIRLQWMDEWSFDFYMIHFLFDLAWAAWHVNQNWSLIIDNETYEWYKIWESIVKRYIKWELSEWEAYNLFLSEKAKRFNIELNSPKSYALVKIACMIRAKTQNDVQNLIDVFDSLGENTKAILIKELNKTWLDDWYASLLYYSPALLSNLQWKLWKKEGLELWLLTLARIFQEVRINLKNRKWNWVYTVMIKPIADLAGSNPDKLKNINFEFIQVWNDVIIEPVDIHLIDESFIDKRTTLTDLEKQIPWKRIVIWWIWWWSDAIQATALSQILTKNSKEIPFIFSVRTKKTWSEWKSWKIWEDRAPQNATKTFDDVYLITSETEMKWRSLEPLVAGNIKTYLIIIDEWEDISQKLEKLIEFEWWIDTIIWVDTWWDALYWTWAWFDNSKTTPDQDLLVLNSINNIRNVQYKLSCEIAVWIDSPSDSWEVLKEARAVCYKPSDTDRKEIIAFYKHIWMDWTTDNYWKTAFAWQKALNWETWLQELPIPSRVVTNDENPWIPYVHITSLSSYLFFMKTWLHIDAIRRVDPINNLY